MFSERPAPIPLTRRRERTTDPFHLIERREKPFAIETGVSSMASSTHKTGFCEDTGFSDNEHGLIVVGDGLGSGPAPHLASRQAPELIQHILTHGTDPRYAFSDVIASPIQEVWTQDEVETALRDFLFHVDECLREASDIDPEVAKFAPRKFAEIYERPFVRGVKQDERRLRSMIFDKHATTEIIGKFWMNEQKKPRLSIGFVGDSRLYRIRNNEIVQLTKDDSMLQICIDAGLIKSEDAEPAPWVTTKAVKALSEDVRLSPTLRHWMGYLYKNHKDETYIDLDRYANMVMNTLGGGTHMLAHPNVVTCEVESKDIYLAVSDGVTKVMSSEDLRLFFAKHSHLPAPELARTLVEHARALAEAQPELMDDITATCAKCS